MSGGALPAPGFDANAIAAHFAEHAWTRPVLMPGAEQTLSTLRRIDLPLGIVTNGSTRSQRRKLTNTGLIGRVDHVVISGEFGPRKPDPSIFLAACKHLDIVAGASWFVGDNPAVDIVGASAVGLRTVWLERAMPWPEDVPRCYTHSASSLEGALNAILRDL